MIALLFATALAQQPRIELEVTDTALGNVTTSVRALDLRLVQPADLAGIGGAAGGRLQIDQVTLHRDVDSLSDELLTAFRNIGRVDTVVIRTYEPNASGAETLVQEVTLTEGLPVAYAVTGRASDPAPRERVAFTASCVQVTGYALDGSTPATSTYTWDFLRNQPGCGE